MRQAKEIYSRETIARAVSDYAGIAKIAVDEDDKYWNLEFSKCVYDTDVTKMEFENYLIGLENAYL